MIKIKGYYALFFAILFVVMVAAPLPLLSTNSYSPTNQDTDNCFIIKNEKNGKTEKVNEKDYVIGVLAGEMDSSSPVEALKAQAVAAYTYAVYKRNLRIEKGLEYDLSSSHSSDQEYLTTTEQVALWQENYNKNREILENIVNEVQGVTITFGGKPILAVYHSASCGKTEAAANIWSGNYPYLQSVESSADMLSPEYKSELKFSAFDFADRALDLGVTLVGSPDTWLGESIRSDSGYILEYSLAGHKISGVDMRSAYSLPSANFELKYANNTFVFIVHGNGHGVGMSQFGAKHLAEQGSNYVQILEYYYPGTIVEIPHK